MSVEITQWLDALGLSKYSSLFLEQEIDLSILPELSNEDLQELGIPLGPRKKILKATQANVGQNDSLSHRLNAQANEASAVVAERRQLTVMFADLAGSSEMSTQMDPEELREIILSFQDASKTAIEKYGGYIARYMGDGILAYFGYPQAHENDPERSALAGIDLLRRAEALSKRFRSTRDIKFNVRVGIATGAVVVGDLIGETSSAERAVVGETPNIAARIESAAPLNTVVVGETTHQLLRNRFEVDELEPQMMKGFDEPMRLFQVLAEKRFNKRKIESAEQIEFVGRSSEMKVLLNSWSDACASISTATLVSGEPGVGKSRFLAELQRRIGADSPSIIEYRCSPFHTNTAFYPLVDHWLFDADIRDDDDAPSMLRKLESILLPATQPTDLAVQLLASLLGFEIPAELPPEFVEFPRRRFEAIQNLHLEQWAARAEKRPLLIIFEDAHWMDPSTIDLIERFTSLNSKQRIMTLVSTRPSEELSQSLYGLERSIKLGGLSQTETELLIKNLPGSDSLGAAELRAVVERTDGVPLFIEELTKLVLERSTVQSRDHDSSIPNTLIDSLTERLDRLGSAKETAQVGASIGREFSYRLLATIVSRSTEALDRDIERLVFSGLIEPTISGDGTAYRFKHALIQDAAYGTLLYATRKQHHSKIADTLIEEIPVLGSEPQVIARHLAEAGRSLEAIDHWYEAGVSATSRSENVEATNHLMSGIATLQSLPPDGANLLTKELDLQIALGTPLIAARGYASVELENAYSRALEIGKQLDGGITNFRILHGLGAFYLIAGKLNQSVSLQRQALELANQNDNRVQQLHATSWLGTILFYRAEMPEAVQLLQHSIQLYEQDEIANNTHEYGLNPGVLARTHLVWYHWLTGDIDQAYLLDESTLQFARQLDHPLSFAHALNFSVVLQLFLGNFETSRTRAEELFRHATNCQLPHYIAYATITGGYARAQLSEAQKGMEGILAGLEARIATGAALAQPMFLTMYAEILASTGQYEESLMQLKKAHDLSDQTTELWYSLETARTQNLVRGKHGHDVESVLGTFEQIIERSRTYGFKSLELRSLNSLVETNLELGLHTDSAVLERLTSLITPMPETTASRDHDLATQLVARNPG